MLNGPEPETLAIGVDELFGSELFGELGPVSAAAIRVRAKTPARIRNMLCASATELFIGCCRIFFRKFRR